MVCHSLLQWTTFCHISPPWPARLGLPHGHGLVSWVRQGCGPSVIRLTSFLWIWFQCVCPLMPSCNTNRLTWVSLTLGVGYLFTAAPYLGWGVSPHRRPSWPSTWNSSSRTSCACAATAPGLRRGVAPPGCCPWPQVWGSSNFLKRSLIFPILLFSFISLHSSLRKAFLSLLAVLWNSAFKWVYLSFSPLPLFLFFSPAICKASSDNHFAFVHFFFLGMALITVSCTVSQTSVHSSSSTLSDLIP